MKRSTRWLLSVVGLFLLLIGLLCLNYTKADALEHHREFARRNNLPQPGSPILWGGAASISLGSALIGYVIATNRRISAVT
jgi:hypothetical protein